MEIKVKRLPRKDILEGSLSTANIIFEGDRVQNIFIYHLVEIAMPEIMDWENDSFDYYDRSFELYNVPPEGRLNEEAQKYALASGFERCWLNHTDGWETIYFFGSEYEPQRRPPRENT